MGETEKIMVFVGFPVSRATPWANARDNENGELKT
jgi:hypothetical protein